MTSDVGQGTTGQIVQYDHLMPFIKKSIHQVRSNEPRPASYE